MNDVFKTGRMRIITTEDKLVVFEDDNGQKCIMPPDGSWCIAGYAEDILVKKETCAAAEIAEAAEREFWGDTGEYVTKEDAERLSREMQAGYSGYRRVGDTLAVSIDGVRREPLDDCATAAMAAHACAAVGKGHDEKPHFVGFSKMLNEAEKAAIEPDIEKFREEFRKMIDREQNVRVVPIISERLDMDHVGAWTGLECVCDSTNVQDSLKELEHCDKMLSSFLDVFKERSKQEWKDELSNVKPGSCLELLVKSLCTILDDFEDEMFREVFKDYLPTDLPNATGEQVDKIAEQVGMKRKEAVEAKSKCAGDHQWVDNGGLRKSWCKTCDVTGIKDENGNYQEVKE
jgi:hypothetical protein